MSAYYNIKGQSVRVSDHEPNTALRGSSDLYIWTKDACGTSMAVGSQIDRFCDRYGFELKDFEAIIRDFSSVDEECKYMLIEISE